MSAFQNTKHGLAYKFNKTVDTKQRFCSVSCSLFFSFSKINAHPLGRAGAYYSIFAQTKIGNR